jgi:hypothetical protein
MTKFISIDDAYLAGAIERYIFNIPLGQILSGSEAKKNYSELSPTVITDESIWPLSKEAEVEYREKVEELRETGRKEIVPIEPKFKDNFDPPSEDYTPSGGTWFVAGNGKIRKMDPLKTPEWWKNDMELALAAGRMFETEEQAQVAARLQRSFMRFVRCCFDQVPDASEDRFNWLFSTQVAP